jgi:tetratricopeptide (TPR) repeat protein
MAKENGANRKMTSEEQRDLDVKIAFMEGVLKRDPAFVEALQELGNNYTRRGKFVAGLQVDEQLSQLRPQDPIIQYNLACSYSLTGGFNQAIDTLERAIDLGYRDFEWMGQDPDLAALREHELYKNIRAKIRRLKSAQV